MKKNIRDNSYRFSDRLEKPNSSHIWEGKIATVSLVLVVLNTYKYGT